VNSGLTYGAGSLLQQARIPGAIAITTYTKAESTTRAIDLALEILKRLHDKGITAAQLASAKAYLKGTFPMRRLETIDQLADTLTAMELYGLSRDEVDGFNARVDAITLDEANAVARKYYRPDDLTLVLLGPGEKIREAVRKYDPRPAELSIKSAGWGL
jgi:zinc protease